MRKRKPLGAQEPRHHWRVRCWSSPLRDIFLHCNLAYDKRRRFLVAGFLSLLALCLAFGFVAFIVLEAFDSDLDLWPFGAEDFTLAPHDSPATAGQSVEAFSAVNPGHRFIVSAGAHLVVGHRARSTLPTDSLPDFIALSVAEPREPLLNAVPALGHFFC